MNTEIQKSTKSQRTSLRLAARRLRIAAHNVFSHVPGARPAHVAVDLIGSFPARKQSQPSIMGIPIPMLGASEMSLQEVCEAIEALGRAEWLETVIFRIHHLR